MNEDHTRDRAGQPEPIELARRAGEDGELRERPGRQAGDGVTAEADGAIVYGDEARDGAQERGLAGSRRARGQRGGTFCSTPTRASSRPSHLIVALSPTASTLTRTTPGG